MAVDADLLEAVRRFEARLRPLQDYGINIHEPGWVARLKERKDVMASMHAEEQRLRDEIDRSGIIPRLVDACIAGGDQDRQTLRALFAECGSFAHNWGPEGRKISFPDAPVTSEQFFRALAVHAMRDGDRDYRDEILLLDGLCKRGKASALDTAALLRQAAALASDEPRGGRKSFREALIERAASL
jgi:hypothetical protein